jgi:nucleotide-binding universal stress UspA family protein
MTDETTSGPALICYDGSPESDRALDAALSVLGCRDYLLVGVWQSLQTRLAEAGVADTSDEDEERIEDESVRTRTEALLERAAERVAAGGQRVATRIDRAETSVFQKLLDVADEIDAALIVTGAHGRGPVRRAVLGSVSRELLAHSQRPVMVVPDQQ